MCTRPEWSPSCILTVPILSAKCGVGNAGTKFGFFSAPCEAGLSPEVAGYSMGEGRDLASNESLSLVVATASVVESG